MRWWELEWGYLCCKVGKGMLIFLISVFFIYFDFELIIFWEWERDKVDFYGVVWCVGWIILICWCLILVWILCWNIFKRCLRGYVWSWRGWSCGLDCMWSRWVIISFWLVSCIVVFYVIKGIWLMRKCRVVFWYSYRDIYKVMVCLF